MERSVIPLHLTVILTGAIFLIKTWRAYRLNRHRYWVALGQAYAMTGDEKYAAVFSQRLGDWIDRNPVPENLRRIR